jgi:fluoride exporter
MTAGGLLAVAFGAVLGAWARWGLSIALNQSLPIGVAVAYFGQLPGLSPEWRLFAVTGFLGALTTFSTFSAEAVALLQSAQYGWALLHSGLHLFGSLVATFLGIATVRALA